MLIGDDPFTLIKDAAVCSDGKKGGNFMVVKNFARIWFWDDLIIVMMCVYWSNALMLCSCVKQFFACNSRSSAVATKCHFMASAHCHKWNSRLNDY